MVISSFNGEPAPHPDRNMIRPDPELIERALHFSSVTLYEAAEHPIALPGAIKPLEKRFQICGPVVTVYSPHDDNLWLHRAIYQAEMGDILLVDTGGSYETGYWGEIMTSAAKYRGIGGLVLDGCARDGNSLEDLNFPIFSRGLRIRSTTKNQDARGFIKRPIYLGGCEIQAGDLVRGDCDGVVVLPQSRIQEILAAAEQRADREREWLERLKAGATTLELLQLQ